MKKTIRVTLEGVPDGVQLPEKIELSPEASEKALEIIRRSVGRKRKKGPLGDGGRPRGSDQSE